jgi:glycosyltransferase involved in cell wall biosynthesis
MNVRYLPISAFVITFNEARRLRECLESLAFCEQIIVVDLGSSDGCAEIARAMGAEVHCHERLPIVEMILPRVAHLARHPWRMRCDPDEVLDARVMPEVARLLDDTKVGLIRLPSLYHFKGRALWTTVWGGVRHMNVFFHAERTVLRPHVHQGIVCLASFVTKLADADGLYPVRHYWVDSWEQMMEKHRRYLGQEGAARYANGQRFTWSGFAREGVLAFKAGWWNHSGWRGGLHGWFLSGFYAWYIMAAHLALRAYEQARSHSGLALSKEGGQP